MSDRSHARAMIEAQDGTAASAQASGSPLKDVTEKKSKIQDSCHEGTQARAQDGQFPYSLDAGRQNRSRAISARVQFKARWGFT